MYTDREACAITRVWFMVEREKILCGWGRVCVSGVDRRGS